MIRRLKKSLLNVAAYPEPTDSVSLVETHVSYIFITKSFVYKVKKAVDLGFLNFTTLDRRRFYCEEEVRLNSRLCPELYLGVVELRQGARGLCFGGEGTLVDYAVKMHRLPEERILAHLVRSGQVEPAQMAQVGRTVAQFHLRARRGPEIDQYGSAEAIRARWQQNFRQAAPFESALLPAAELEQIRGWVEDFLARRADLLRERVEKGHIRECDGDLHLGNICLTEEAAPGVRSAHGVCIFDCIEFNEAFRCIDTAADLGFLLMDLEYNGHPELCHPFLAAYQEIAPDPGLSELLDFYRCNAAFVRGKVTGLRLREGGLTAAEHQAGLGEARRYFRLARGYTLRGRLAPALVITCGLMGSGKSALARELSRELGLQIERSDLVRRELAGAPSVATSVLPSPSGAAGSSEPAVVLPSPSGRGAGVRGPVPGEPPPPAWEASPAMRDYGSGRYSAEAKRAVYDELLQRAEQALGAGRGILVDATFQLRAERDRFRELAQRLGAGFYLLETTCPPEVARERLEARRHDPHEASEGNWELYPRHAAGFESPEPGEAIRLDSALPLYQVVDQALKGMGLLS